jgi:VIT1/CCC1 family predicted Fe2+/Mn2+ transporter
MALALTGSVAASIGGGPRARAAVRLVLGGALALGLTYAIGSALGTAGVA